MITEPTITTAFRRRVVLSLLVGLVLLPGRAAPRLDAQLAPTVHAALPADSSDLWLVPSATDRAARSTATYQSLATASQRYADADYSGAVAALSGVDAAGTPLADYARYYNGLAQLKLGRFEDARRTFESLLDRKPQGYLTIAAALGAGEAAEGAGDNGGAVRIYEKLADQKSIVNDEILTRLGHAALLAGDRAKAAGAFVRVYYEFPLTDAATAAAAQLTSLQDQVTHSGYKLDLGRAQLLFGARRYTEARAAFQDLQRVAEGDDKELVDLRVAESDFNLKRWAAARDGVRPYTERASRQAEAQFFYLSSLRELGDFEQSIALTAALVAAFPDSSWSEEALNNLATHYILQNEDALAATTFREMFEKFPTGPRAERAAWKYGWSAYKTGDYAETVRVFEGAATTFPRSDYRPSWLYWSARSHAKLGEATQADARLRLVYTDYANSYYGRLAERQLQRRAGGLTAADNVRLASNSTQPPVDVTPIPTDGLIRLLLANGLYDDALNELRYAQRMWGTSPRLDATVAWVYHQKGELRRAISIMRRAYPQFLTAGGQQLPAELLQVIFPLTYWDSIRKQSALYGLDPYVIAALIAQESTFDAKIKSAANAWGLMQVVPATGRRLARSLGIRGFSTASLTNPEINIRLGTLYFSRLVEQFGGTYYALASYNAGENRVVRWKAERPGLDEDEFIDDIPFPETQNYVKRILGTAEDYRTLYTEAGGTPRPVVASPAAAAKAPAVKPAKTPTKKSTVKKPGAKKPTVKKPTVKKPGAKKKAPAKKKKAPAKKPIPKRP